MIAVNKRIITLFIIVSLFLIIFFRFFYLQVVEYDKFKDRAINKVVRGLPVYAERGLIKDRLGNVIVDNAKVYDLQLLPYDTNEDFNFALLLNYVNFDSIKIKNKIKRAKKSFGRKFTPISIRNKISRDIVFKIEEQRDQFPGLLVREVFVREYVDDSNLSMAHVLGGTKIERKSFNNPIFDLINLNPRGGLENYYNHILKGVPGKEFHLFDVSGIDRGMYDGDLYTHKNPVSGQDLILTIDSRLQSFIYSIMRNYEGKEYDGSVICSIPSTGEIIAFVNNPTIDIKKMSIGISQKELDSLNTLNSPYLNRGISAYIPGSVMKLPVAMMLLEEGFDKNMSYSCNNRYIFPNSNSKVQISEQGDTTIVYEGKDCHANHGEVVTLREALSKSCNIFFYQSVLENYHKTYKNKWYDWMNKNGFSDFTGIDLLYEKKAPMVKKPSKSKMLNMVIGQEVLVTPLQVLNMVNLIANNGITSRPHFNKALPIQTEDLGLSNSTLQFIKSAMSDAVNLDTGTAFKSKIESDNVKVRAKTGTAQISAKDANNITKKATHAWYAGFLEFDENEKISIVIMLEKGGSGGEAAALMAKQIFEEAISINSRDSFYD